MGTSQTDELVDEIEVIRERLAGTVDSLVDRTNPKNIARRSLAGLKARFVDEQGSPRFETIVPVALGVVGVVAAAVVLRRLVR